MRDVNKFGKSFQKYFISALRCVTKEQVVSFSGGKGWSI